MDDKLLKVQSSIMAIQRKLDSLRKIRLATKANDYHAKSSSFLDFENDVFDSEDYFSED